MIEHISAVLIHHGQVQGSQLRLLAIQVLRQDIPQDVTCLKSLNRPWNFDSAIRFRKVAEKRFLNPFALEGMEVLIEFLGESILEDGETRPLIGQDFDVGVLSED